MTAGTAAGDVVGPEDLDRAVHGDGLRVHLQPILDLTRATVVGYEALARFDGPVTSPEVWFDAAHACGRAAELEAAAVRAALSRRAELPPMRFLTVNVSPDVLSDPVMQQVWREAAPLRGVVVELTEQRRFDEREVQAELTALRAAGAFIAIDDTGSGYAGLHRLLVVRPHFIKIDRGLVAGVDQDEGKRALIEMLGIFGNRVDAWLLAEGIETPEELEALMQLGVPLGQGYLLGRPTAEPVAPSAEAVRQVLAHRRVHHDGEGLGPLLERVPTAPDVASAHAVVAREGVDLVVVVDADHGPVSTVCSAGHVEPVREAGLRLHVDTPLHEAARRAIVRTPVLRFRPLVCIDAQGRLAGIVRMERLVEALAQPAAG
ncbi:EAL domain-containing protein [Aeromicrobium massiliense]|uniref:EAL domain-containing protein n=1 Tax=Aeromicrobium massiliense TaxID=1464554 RepID=UPI0002EAFF9E|nr:EAL domain-containing protein [Aeromicrobium massiliense]